MIFIEKIVWFIATIFLFVSGIYFTFKLNFVQLRFTKMIKALKEQNRGQGLSPFQSLTITLGARIGVGSLAGIALAIYYGGIGTIFWIWVSALFCSANAFAESVLGVLYRSRQKRSYVGGPAYYIEKGMNNKPLARIYALILLFAYIAGFLTVQINTMVKAVTEIYRFNNLILAGVIVLFVLYVIFKGLDGISKIATKLIPIMALGYILIGCYILCLEFDKIPFLIKSIIRGAFNIKASLIGFLTPLIIGFQRGTFSNEAGLGTGAIVSAASATKSPTNQGFIQVFGIHLETLVMATITAFLIILSNYTTYNLLDINGIELTQKAFAYHLGNSGYYIVMIIILLFAFSTIITGYYYGETNLKFLFNKLSLKGIILFKLIVGGLLFLGGILSPRFIWFWADVLIAIIGIINVYALFSLRKSVVKVVKDI